MKIKVGPSWIDPKAVHGKDGGLWRNTKMAWVKVNGTWQFVWENVFRFTISSNQINLNLRTAAVNAGWNQYARVEATIAGGVVISCSSTNALIVDGSWPLGVTLINYGYILGRAGNGGAGGASTDQAYNGAGGGWGTTGLAVYVPITINNQGVIAGGGGGGGGGAGAFANASGGSTKGGDAWVAYGRAGGGGGGGGRSNAYNSSGGAASWGQGGVTGAAGAGGGFNGPGGGGAGGLHQPRTGYIVHAGTGGAGGGWGANGANGGNTIGYAGFGSGQWRSGGPAGGAGLAVWGNNQITWAATGSLLGGISA